MVFQCVPCSKSFVNWMALSQHQQNSSAHNGSGASSRGNTPQLRGRANRASTSQYRGHRGKTTRHPQGSNHGAPQTPSIRWSDYPVDQHEKMFEALAAHCHGAGDLLKNNFVLQPYTAEDLDGFRKCKNCGGMQKAILLKDSAECTFHPKMRGNAHSKTEKSQTYSCCETKYGCVSLPAHSYATVDRQTKDKYSGYAASPLPSRQHQKFRAVTLDCEMAGAVGGMGELIAVCAIDYLTGNVILNALVSPVKRIYDWRSKFHGVTEGMMTTAIMRGDALVGWKGAREELWKYIDTDTILIGHALHHDLEVLKMIHPRVVDSEILSRQSIGLGIRQWGLKTLCQELMSIEIRANEGGVHDCLEDVFATREVVISCIHNPENLRDWARAKKIEEVRLRDERERLRDKKRQKLLEEQEELQLARMSLEDDNFDSGDSSEVLNWSDIAVDLGWPHPDTGYDPWSD